MMDYEKIGEISVPKILRDFIGDEVLPGTDVGAGQFWSGLAGLVGEFAPRIRDQLRFRDALQEKIDEYHRVTASRPFDPAAYGNFLREVGYLIPEPPNFTVRTEHVLENARHDEDYHKDGGCRRRHHAFRRLVRSDRGRRSRARTRLHRDDAGRGAGRRPVASALWTTQGERE